MIIYFGKVSLSLFLVHYTFLSLFINYLNILFFVLVWLAFTGFMGFLMYIWIEFAKGVGSPEWIMVQVGRIGRKTGHAVKKETHLIVDKLKKDQEHKT